jgi:hypothetical protein
MPLAEPLCLELWYRALAADVGIAISTNEPRILSNNLYDARRSAADPELETISVIIQPLPNEVWLVKKEARNG